MKIRVRGGFSDRNNIKKIDEYIQIKKFSEDSRIAISNRFIKLLREYFDYGYYFKKDFIEHLFLNIFNEEYEPDHNDFEDVIDIIKKIIKESEYHDVLTLIEAVCQYLEQLLDGRGYQIRACFSKNSIFEYMNKEFEKEFIGYRFVGEIITQIINDHEIKQIEESINTPFDKVNQYIIKSIKLLGETKEKDYSNSIKEAITGLEEFFNVNFGKSGLTLSNAVNQAWKKLDINEKLKEAIVSLYRFTSDENGIRHGNNKEPHEVNFDDAKFVLITCSSIINYILNKTKILDRN